MLVRVTTDYVMNGQVNQNVLHFSNPDGLLTLSQIADDIQTNWINNLRVVTDDNGSWTKITVRNLDDLQQSVFVKQIAVTGGADFGNQNVPFAGAVLQFLTDLAGRRGRGRYYHAGSSFSWLSNGLITTNARTTWELRLNILRDAYVGPSSTISPLWLHIFHRDGSGATAVRAIQLRATFGAQRRRNIGVGM